MKGPKEGQATSWLTRCGMSCCEGCSQCFDNKVMKKAKEEQQLALPAPGDEQASSTASCGAQVGNTKGVCSTWCAGHTHAFDQFNSHGNFVAHIGDPSSWGTRCGMNCCAGCDECSTDLVALSPNVTVSVEEVDPANTCKGAQLLPSEPGVCAEWCPTHRYGSIDAGVFGHEAFTESTWRSRCQFECCGGCRQCQSKLIGGKRSHVTYLTKEVIVRGEAAGLNATLEKIKMRALHGCYAPNCSVSLDVQRPHNGFAPSGLRTRATDDAADIYAFERFRRSLHVSGKMTSNLNLGMPRPHYRHETKKQPTWAGRLMPTRKAMRKRAQGLMAQSSLLPVSDGDDDEAVALGPMDVAGLGEEMFCKLARVGLVSRRTPQQQLKIIPALCKVCPDACNQQHDQLIPIGFNKRAQMGCTWRNATTAGNSERIKPQLYSILERLYKVKNTRRREVLVKVDDTGDITLTVCMLMHNGEDVLHFLSVVQDLRHGRISEDADKLIHRYHGPSSVALSHVPALKPLDQKLSKLSALSSMQAADKMLTAMGAFTGPTDSPCTSLCPTGLCDGLMDAGRPECAQCIACREASAKGMPANVCEMAFAFRHCGGQTVSDAADQLFRSCDHELASMAMSSRFGMVSANASACEDTMAWSLSNVEKNRLGGIGPDSHGEHVIRYRDIVKVGPIFLDLIVANSSAYVSHQARTANGVQNDVGSIHMSSGNAVKLRFRLVRGGTNVPFSLPSFTWKVLGLNMGARCGKALVFNNSEVSSFSFDAHETRITSEVSEDGAFTKFSVPPVYTDEPAATATDELATPTVPEVVMFTFANSSGFTVDFVTHQLEDFSGFPYVPDNGGCEATGVQLMFTGGVSTEPCSVREEQQQITESEAQSVQEQEDKVGHVQEDENELGGASDSQEQQQANETMQCHSFVRSGAGLVDSTLLTYTLKLIEQVPDKGNCMPSCYNYNWQVCSHDYPGLDVAQLSSWNFKCSLDACSSCSDCVIAQTHLNAKEVLDETSKEEEESSKAPRWGETMQERVRDFDVEGYFGSNASQIVCDSMHTEEEDLCEHGDGRRFYCSTGAIYDENEEASTIHRRKLEEAGNAMRLALEELVEAQNKTEAADVAREEEKAYAEETERKIAEIDATVAMIEWRRTELPSSLQGQSFSQLAVQHKSLQEAVGKIEAIERDLAIGIAPSTLALQDVRRLAAADGLGCYPKVPQYDARTCVVQPLPRSTMGVSELWASHVPCGPWGESFPARMQTFHCPASCPGDWCGKAGDVATAFSLGELRIEIIGQVVTTYVNGSSLTIRRSGRVRHVKPNGKSETKQHEFPMHVGNHFLVEHSCTHKLFPNSTEHGCWTIRHPSGLRVETSVVPREQMPTQFIMSFAVTTPNALAQPDRCSGLAEALAPFGTSEPEIEADPAPNGMLSGGIEPVHAFTSIEPRKVAPRTKSVAGVFPPLPGVHKKEQSSTDVLATKRRAGVNVVEGAEHESRAKLTVIPRATAASMLELGEALGDARTEYQRGLSRTLELDETILRLAKSHRSLLRSHLQEANVLTTTGKRQGDEDEDGEEDGMDLMELSMTGSEPIFTQLTMDAMQGLCHAQTDRKTGLALASGLASARKPTHSAAHAHHRTS